MVDVPGLVACAAARAVDRPNDFLKETAMAFHAYDLPLQLIREVRPAWVELRAHDVDEAKQLRKATSSITRNLANPFT